MSGQNAMQDAKSSEPQILIDLSTAIIGTDSGTFQCRLVEDDTDTNPGRLPFGPFVPDQHRTMEIGLRQWVGEQVGVGLGHVEQLYTFADRGRQHATPGAPHVVSVGYLALTNQTGSQTQSWRDIYNFFPWEDWRDGEPSMLADIIYPALDSWLTQHAERRESARLAFGRDGLPWGEEYVLERYELLYEAGLVSEAFTDGRENAAPTPVVPGEALTAGPSPHFGNRCGPIARKIEISAGNFRPHAANIYPDPVTAHGRNGAGCYPAQAEFPPACRKIGLFGSHGTHVKARGRPAELFKFRHQERSERPLAGLRVSVGPHPCFRCVMPNAAICLLLHAIVWQDLSIIPCFSAVKPHILSVIILILSINKRGKMFTPSQNLIEAGTKQHGRTNRRAHFGRNGHQL